MFRGELSAAATAFGLELTAAQLDALEKFYRPVVEQNRVMNLTAIS